MHRPRRPAAAGGTPAASTRPPVARGTFQRDRALERLAAEEFDVLVVGGGVTGAGVALDAASRGLRTALVDKGDFASGTSSKSSKLVHGGLRYLQQREFRLVYENLAERQRLLVNAPHLVTRLPFLIPLFGRDGVVSRTVARSYATALWLYDLTGGLRIGRRHRRVSKAEALGHLPLLRTERLVAGFLYYDAQADDARLTLTLLQTAALDFGAVVANYVDVVGLHRGPDDTAHRATVRPLIPGASAPGPEIEVRAAVVVNATGVWADDVRALDEATHPHSIRPAKGIHVTVPAARLPCDIAAVIPVAEDKRSIFVVPWTDAGLVYIGTTDTAYDGPLDDPACTPDDVDYLLNAVNAATTAGLERDDVTGVWSGLRPLLAPSGGRRHVSERTADLSRRHTVRTSDDGVVTVTGGKLTTYRQMAEETVDAVADLLPGPPVGRSVTAKLALHGAPTAAGRHAERVSPAPLGPGSEGALLHHLRHRYGTSAEAVVAVADGRPELLSPVVEGLPYLGAEVVWAAREEMAETVDDVLSRRTRARIQQGHHSAAAAPLVARLLADELGWSDERVATEVATYVEATEAELHTAGVGAAATVTPTPVTPTPATPTPAAPKPAASEPAASSQATPGQQR